MSEAWKKHDRPCPPCANCGAELYEKFWGNGGWAKTDKAADKTHHDSDCVKVLKARVPVPPLTVEQERETLLRIENGGREIERRRIVEWIRGRTIRGLHQTQSPWDLTDAADCIERGEHLSVQPK